MTDQPENRPNGPKNGGWFVPEGAVQPSVAAPASAVLPPTDAEPARPGGWYVPLEATERVAAILLAAQSPQSSGPQVGPAPEATATYTPPDTTPTTEIVENALSDEESGVTAPEREVKPETETTPVPQGAKLSTEVDYSNYVPGVGFVAPGKAVPQPATDAAVSTQTEQKEFEQDEAVQPEMTLNALDKPEDDKTDAAKVAGFSTPEPHHAETLVDDKPLAAPEPHHAAHVEAEAPEASKAALEQKTEQPADPAQRFYEVERSVQALRRRYTAGGMTRDQLKEALRNLMILDNDGIYWMIGLETDRWYRYNGSEWLLANPPGYKPPELVIPGGTPQPGTASGFPQRKFDIPLDEHGMPLPKQVPLEDDGATMVGRWASRLEQEGRHGGGVMPYDGGVTVPSRALDLTQPSGAVHPDAVRTKQAWERRLAASNAPGAGVTMPARVPAGTGGAGIPGTIAPGSQITSPKIESIQPDYGIKPGGLMLDRQRYGGCLIRLAVLSVFLVLGGSVLAVIAAVLGYYGTINRYESGITNLQSSVTSESQSVRIYDATGRQLFQLNDPNRGASFQVKIEDVSPYAIFAIVATENERFYSDPGFDIIAFSRAIIQNLRAGAGLSGASTITQQMARARVLEPGAAADRSVGRKINEIVVSTEIARRYTKSQIMEFYLNTTYFGNLAYGIEAAAQTYFKKSAKDLDIAEASLLAGLIQQPAGYDPAIKPAANEVPPAIKRARLARQLMLSLGCIQMEHTPFNQAPFCITKSDMDKAVVQIAQMEAKIAGFVPPTNTATYPHFVQYVREQLESDPQWKDVLYTSGLKVYTTIDPRVQDAAQNAATSQIENIRRLRATNAAVFALRPTDGAILAMVGSVDFNNKDIDGQVNVTLASRQPGSSIKPFVYLTALERNQEGNYWTPGTIIWDVESCFGGGAQPYCPVNYDRRFHGPVSMRTALAGSINIAAVKALAYAGLDRFKAVADRVGIKFLLTPLETAGLAAALGAAEVRMIDLVDAYAVLANGGKKVTPYAIARITRVKDGKEEEIFKYTPPEPRQEVEPGLAYLLTSILSDNNARAPYFGRNSVLQLRNGHIAAVKTGTTNDYRDNWTVGYTPNIVVGVWVGNSNGTPMVGSTGLTGAAPIWNQVMTAVLSGTQPQQFPVPEGVGQADMCLDLGTLAGNSPACKNLGREIIFARNPPPALETLFRQVPVDTFTGLIANENCQEYIEQRTYLTITDPTALSWVNNTPEGQQWATERGLKLPLEAPPTASCQPGQPRPFVVITSPTPQQQVSGLMQVQGAIDIPGFNRYQIEVGQGHQPTAFGIVDGPITAQPGRNPTFLGRWDTTSVPNGPYTVKVWAVNSDGNFVQVLIPVIVNNIAGQATPPPIATTDPNQLPGFPPTTDPGFPPTTDPNFPPPTFDSGQGAFPPTETPVVIQDQPPGGIFPPTTSP